MDSEPEPEPEETTNTTNTSTTIIATTTSSTTNTTTDTPTTTTSTTTSTTNYTTTSTPAPSCETAGVRPINSTCPEILYDNQSCIAICGLNFTSVGVLRCSLGTLVGESTCLSSGANITTLTIVAGSIGLTFPSEVVLEEDTMKDALSRSLGVDKSSIRKLEIIPDTARRLQARRTPGSGPWRRGMPRRWYARRTQGSTSYTINYEVVATDSVPADDLVSSAGNLPTLMPFVLTTVDPSLPTPSVTAIVAPRTFTNQGVAPTPSPPTTPEATTSTTASALGSTVSAISIESTTGDSVLPPAPLSKEIGDDDSSVGVGIGMFAAGLFVGIAACIVVGALYLRHRGIDRILDLWKDPSPEPDTGDMSPVRVDFPASGVAEGVAINEVRGPSPRAEQEVQEEAVNDVDLGDDVWRQATMGHAQSQRILGIPQPPPENTPLQPVGRTVRRGAVSSAPPAFAEVKLDFEIPDDFLEDDRVEQPHETLMTMTATMTARKSLHPLAKLPPDFVDAGRANRAGALPPPPSAFPEIEPGGHPRDSFTPVLGTSDSQDTLVAVAPERGEHELGGSFEVSHSLFHRGRGDTDATRVGGPSEPHFQRGNTQATLV